jgi:hypothetical protein
MTPEEITELLMNNEAALAVNILRRWPEEKIRRFALHLLGDGNNILAASHLSSYCSCLQGGEQ